MSSFWKGQARGINNLEAFARWQLSPGFSLPPNAPIPEEILDFLAARWEWEDKKRLDSLGNQDHQDNPLFCSGRYLEPVVNKWVHTQSYAAGESPWPQGKKFAVCLTHDVDFVSYTSWQPRIRQACNLFVQALKDQDEAKTWIKSRILRLLKPSSGMAPANQGEATGPVTQDLFGPWLAAEDRYGWRSTFFFLPDRISRYHPLDGRIYRYQDRLAIDGQRLTVAELMREMDRRGWEIGLHGSYNSFANVEELKRQKEQIDRVLGKEITSTRQHCLHFDIRQTPRAQAQAGFKYDSTFGSNGLVGFRNGLAWPFYFFDLKKEQGIPLLEIPLHIQDGALLSPQALNLTPKDALAGAIEIIDRVETARGLITLLWHPHAVNPRRYPGWFWVYEELLHYISEKEAWVAPVGELGQWWETQLQRNGDSHRERQ